MSNIVLRLVFLLARDLTDSQDYDPGRIDPDDLTARTVAHFETLPLPDHQHDGRAETPRPLARQGASRSGVLRPGGGSRNSRTVKDMLQLPGKKSPFGALLPGHRRLTGV